MGIAAASPILDDRFLLLESLGRGGMGSVYRAFDGAERRLVALKFLSTSENGGPAHLLSAEYEAWTRLRHPNIVRAYELSRARRGPLPPGTPYLVLENFIGQPAHVALAPGRVQPRLLEELGRRVLQALVHVHAAGLVHRDLKPGNVLVGPARRGSGRVKLTDFGLATATGTAREPGRVSGSFHYIAPESVLGLPLDGRADLYGLGILLYLLATGRLPVSSRDPGDILRWHLEGPPADPREGSSCIPDRLARFILRLTARNRDHRPASAAEALFLLGAPHPDLPHRSRPVAPRGDRTRLGLALDAVRLGRRRLIRLPPDPCAARALVRDARVQAQVHGLGVLELSGRRGHGRSNLARVVLRLLLERGHEVRALVEKHRLQRGLPLALFGSLPVWDRIRAEGKLEPQDPWAIRATARGVATFLLDSASRRTLVLVVHGSALSDPLTCEVVKELTREADDRAARPSGLLLLVPHGAGRARTHGANPGLIRDPTISAGR